MSLINLEGTYKQNNGLRGHIIIWKKKMKQRNYSRLCNDFFFLAITNNTLITKKTSLHGRVDAMRHK